MRIASKLRRLVPALLALLVLLLSIASSGHSHLATTAAAGGAAIAVDAQHDLASAGGERGCALCATASRLAHGARAARASSLDVAQHRFDATRPGAAAPRRVDPSRTEARAPPRIG